MSGGRPEFREALDYAFPAPPTGTTVLPKLATVAGILIFIGFVGWCLLDFCYVRFGWFHNRFNEIAALVSYWLTAFVISMRTGKPLDLPVRIAVAFSCAVLVFVFCLISILVLGMPFHFWIGGKM